VERRRSEVSGPHGNLSPSAHAEETASNWGSPDGRPRNRRKKINHDEYSGRVLVVANRLPVKITFKKHGLGGASHVQPPKTPEEGEATGFATDDDDHDIQFQMSDGGLANAMRALTGDKIWIGTPGLPVRARDQPRVARALRKKKCEPVFLGKQLLDGYYNGFSNTILWSLFHYIQNSIHTIRKSEDWFKDYEQANQRFADVVLAEYQPGDLVWVHDYHLFLLPAMLRAARPLIKVGFFLHIPFPSSEVFKIIPQREMLLR
jgi:trehalose-6-phosphate synthase